MKKLIWICFLFIFSTAVNAFALSIHSYQELASAMQAGDRFVVVLNIQECTGKSGPIGYFSPSKMMLVPASATSSEYIVTSDLHFTDHKGPRYEYTKYTFNSDNSIAIRTTIYDPLTFKPIADDHVINCSIDKGIRITSYENSSNE